MEALECIFSRRSVRQFSGEPIRDEELEKIVRAAQQAPSAHNTQPWHLLSLRQRDTLRRLIPMTPWWGLLEQCEVAVVVCADTRVCQQTEMPEEFLVHSCAAAQENMLLAAHAQGIGGVWLGMCPGESSYQAFCEILGIPSWARVVGMAAFGRPGTQPAPVNRMEKDKWHREHWDSVSPSQDTTEQ